MGLFASKTSHDLAAKLAALDRVQAIIEFDLDGRILAANANFLKVLGYEAAEVVGQHHGMFVDPAERDAPAYREFWARLKRGEFNAGQFRRVAKGGREVWIEASYNPLLDSAGKPYKVVKFATDITARMAEDADRAGQVAAVAKSQAVIAFDLAGTILDANDNFLAALGYDLVEIKGRHHSMFVDEAERRSPAYAAFWEALRRGEYQAAQYRRIGKGGREIWIQASYNPIFDAAGRPTKVVKFATDITEQVRLLDRLRVLIDRNFGEIDTAIARSDGEARSATDAAESTAMNVDTMASATEEMANSVAEIAESMALSRTASDAAFEQVRSAGERTRKLTDAATAMSGISGMIQTIAAQINLLALNATIESARAGEAGRGFAVVAQEVKNLANQAARATEQIGAEILGVQAVSAEVVGALEAIHKSVETMRGYVVATASAVEEQSAVTRELSGSMQGTAQAVKAISGNVVAIAGAISQVNAAVSSTREAAKVLAR